MLIFKGVAGGLYWGKKCFGKPEETGYFVGDLQGEKGEHPGEVGPLNSRGTLLTRDLDLT